MEGLDLRKFQEEGEERDKIKRIMGRVLSGRSDYEVVEEARVEKVRKCGCGWPIESGAKFCSECGKKC
ncbi:MAG: zinc-ribbon domain-containing protein [archaeon]